MVAKVGQDAHQVLAGAARRYACETLDVIGGAGELPGVDGMIKRDQHPADKRGLAACRTDLQELVVADRRVPANLSNDPILYSECLGGAYVFAPKLN
ncbi:MAG: hypothetical protein WAN46_04960 [Gammaproteobacteria bacterium]